MSTIFSYRFNGRSPPAMISVGVNDDGQTIIYLPGCRERVIVLRDSPVNISIGGDGPGPDVAILLEVSR